MVLTLQMTNWERAKLCLQVKKIYWTSLIYLLLCSMLIYTRDIFFCFKPFSLLAFSFNNYLGSYFSFKIYLSFYFYKRNNYHMSKQIKVTKEGGGVIKVLLSKISWEKKPSCLREKKCTSEIMNNLASPIHESKHFLL